MVLHYNLATNESDATAWYYFLMSLTAVSLQGKIM